MILEENNSGELLLKSKRAYLHFSYTNALEKSIYSYLVFQSRGKIGGKAGQTSPLGSTGISDSEFKRNVFPIN